MAGHAPACHEDLLGKNMNIKAFTSKTAIAACAVAVCALAAGIAAAQTGAPAATSASSSSASPAARPRPHHDGGDQSMGPRGPQHGPMHPPTFEDLDTNHDGVVSKAEFDAWRAAHPMPGHLGGDSEGKGDWHGPHGGWGMRREMMWMHMREMEMHHHGGFGHHFDFDAADADHDGKISWAEFQAAADKHLKERFDKLDKNHDGFIEKYELHGHGDHHWRHDGKDGKSAAETSATATAK